MAVQAVHIKRKRAQDPLQALVVRSSKRTKIDSLVFRLAGTFGTAPADNLYLTSSAESESRVFRIPQKPSLSNLRARSNVPKLGQTDKNANVARSSSFNDPHRILNQAPAVPEADAIPDQLQSMIHEFMKTQNSRDAEIAPDLDRSEAEKTERGTTCMADTTPDGETEDYVYDVYYGEQLDTADAADLPKALGYIELEDGQEVRLLADGEDESEPDIFVDDEDSNAEDFYRNDYPEELNSGSDGEHNFSDDSLGLNDAMGDLHVDEPYWSEDLDG